MTFDPMADLIDLRDVVEEVGEINEPDEAGNRVAYDFLATMADEVYGLNHADTTAFEVLDWARRQADNEPTVIARRYFVEYAQDLADDIGAIDANAGWPLSFIDWPRAADALKMDYSSFTFDGREYLTRST